MVAELNTNHRGGKRGGKDLFGSAPEDIFPGSSVRDTGGLICWLQTELCAEREETDQLIEEIRSESSHHVEDSDVTHP